MPLIWYLFMTRRVLAILLSIVLLASFIGLLLKKYRKYMPRLLILLGALSSALLLSYYFIYWELLSNEKDISRQEVVCWDPFPELLSVTLHWQIPCLLVVIVAALVLKRKLSMNNYSWIGMAIIFASMFGYIVLAYQVFVQIFWSLE